MNFRFWTDSQTEGRSFEDALKIESPENLSAVNQINSAIYKTIRQYHVGAVILFAENLSEPDASKKFIRDLGNAATDGGNPPLLFCTDQEGGNVNRIFDFTMPSAMCIRQSGNLENAFLCAYANGSLLLDYGIQVNFSPVADISTNKANPVIGIRSFGSNKFYVAEYSNATRAGLEKAGAVPCAKHFPGHGDTATDSHIGLPVISRSFSKWKKTEAIPFKKNIECGLPMIMSAHIQMPKIDKTKIFASKTKKFLYPPATLSHKILTTILRDQMGFNGVIVSDAMDMQAISDNFSPSEAFVLAMNAGVNLVCHPINVYSNGDMAFLEEFFLQVEDALSSGRLSQEALDSSVTRILLLKEKAGLIKIQDGKIISLPQKNIPLSWQKKQEAVALSKKVQQLATRFSYKNKIQTDPKDKILVFVSEAEKAEWVKNYFASRTDGYFRPDIEVVSYEGKTELTDEEKEKILSSDTIVIFTQLNGYAVKNKSLFRAAFPKALSEFAAASGKAGRTVCVSTNLPYDNEVFSAKEDFGWCATYGYSAKEYRAALDEIFEGDI